MRKKLVLNWKNIQRKIDFCQKLISHWVFEPFLQCQFWVAGYTPICNQGLAVPAASLRDSSSNASGLNWQAQTFKMPPVCSLSNEWDKINWLSLLVSTKIPSLGLLDRLWARHLYRDKAAINSHRHFDSFILQYDFRNDYTSPTTVSNFMLTRLQIPMFIILFWCKYLVNLQNNFSWA